MRRNTKDELLRGFLAINAMLREELGGLKRTLEKRSAETKYNPNWSKQPRAPRGVPTGGQWVDGGGWSKQRTQTVPSRPGTRDGAPKRQTQQQAQTRTPVPEPSRPVTGEPRRLPPARFGPAATLMTGDAVLRQLNTRTERARVLETVRRFGLDPQSANDVLAARAHVWATHIAPSLSS